MPGKGADITPAATYLVEVSAQAGSYTIERAAILGGFTHAPTKAASDATMSPLAESAKDLPANFRRHNLYASIPSHEIMLRVTDVASTSPSAIEALARMEIREATGKESGFISGTQVFSNDHSKNTQVLIAMAREPMLEHYATSLHNARIRIDALVPTSMALYHCYLVSGELEHRGVQMIAHIGESSTDFIVVDGGDLLAARTINYGLEDFITAFATGLGVNKEQARQVALTRVNISPGHQSDNPSGEGVVRHGQDAAARLAGHLRAAEGYVKAVTGRLNLKIELLALCGTGALIGGLPEFLAHRAQREVTIFNPIAGFSFGTMGGNQRAIVGQHSVTMGIALGLAKIACDHGQGAAVLVPPSVKARNIFFSRSIWLYAAVLVLVLTMGLAYFFSHRAVIDSSEVVKQLQVYEADYRRSHVRIAQNASAGASGDGKTDEELRFAEKSELHQDLLVLTARLEETLSITAGTNYARHVMSALPALLSPGMSIESFAAGPEVTSVGKFATIVRFQVMVRNQSDIAPVLAELKARLKKHPVVAEVSNDTGIRSADQTATTANFIVKLKDPLKPVLGNDGDQGGAQ